MVDEIVDGFQRAFAIALDRQRLWEIVREVNKLAPEEKRKEDRWPAAWALKNAYYVWLARPQGIDDLNYPQKWFFDELPSLLQQSVEYGYSSPSECHWPASWRERVEAGEEKHQELTQEE